MKSMMSVFDGRVRVQSHYFLNQRICLYIVPAWKEEDALLAAYDLPLAYMIDDLELTEYSVCTDRE